MLSLPQWCRMLCTLIVALLPLSGGPAGANGTTERVLIAAASSLRPLLDAATEDFRGTSPGITIQKSYGSTGKLATQVQQGAPFDIFIAADEAAVHPLIAAGLAVRTAPFARGQLVLWSARASDAAGRTAPAPLPSGAAAFVAMLATSRRIALANPDAAPYGARAKQALERAGQWLSVSSRILYSQDVAGVARLLIEGHASAGFIALSLAQRPELSATGRHMVVPETLHDPLNHVLVITRTGKDNLAAAAMAAYLLAPERRGLLERFGYAPLVARPGATSSGRDNFALRP